MYDVEKEKEALLVVDGDFVAFSVASLLETKSIKVLDESENEIGVYKNRTTFKNSEDFDESKKDFYKIEDQQQLDNNWKKKAPIVIRSIIDSYLKKTGTNKVLIAFGAPDNYREEIPSPIRYKSNRDNTIRPLVLKEMKLLMRKLYDYEEPLCGEADDLVSSYQWKSIQEPDKRIVVCTIDKDAKGSSCQALYNPNTEELIEIKGVGSLSLETKSNGRYKLKGQGRIFFYYQLLVGDATDAYFPCSIYKQMKGLTKKSAMLSDKEAYEILKDCKTDKECWEALVKQYKEWYPGEIEWTCWKGEKHKGTFLDPLQHTFTAAYMKRYEEDYPQVKNILDKLQIEY